MNGSTLPRKHTTSEQTVGTGREECEEAEVAKDLELLPDFVANVGVVRMERGERVFVAVDFAKRKILFC